MEVLFLRMVLSVGMLVCFGSIGIRKLLREHPKTTGMVLRAAFNLFNPFGR